MLEHPRNISILVLAVLITVPCGSCRMRPRQDYATQRAHTEKPALHAIQSERLHSLMTELNALFFNRMPQEMDREEQSDQTIGEIEQVAAAMAQSASYIPDTLQDVRISQEDAKLFRQFAAKLQQQSLQLQEFAASEQINEVATKVDEIDITCRNCHDAFRILPVVQDPQNKPG